MKIVLLDTSFILTALAYKIDIKQELRRILDEIFEMKIIDKTLQELQGKALGSLAQAYLASNKVDALPAEGSSVDAALLRYASHSVIVATQDKGLKEKLKKRRMTIITIRQKRYLAVI